MRFALSRISFLISLAATLATAPGAFGFTPGGYDMVDAKATIGLNVDGTSELTLAGQIQIVRQDPSTGAGGLEEQAAEIIGIELRGARGDGSDEQTDPVVGLSLGRAARGYFRQQQPGQDFPADSSFDFLFHVTVGNRLTASRSLSLSAVVDAVLPLQSCYAPGEGFQPVPLLDSSGDEAGSLTSIELCFGEHPTFTVAPGNPSGFDAADLYDVPTTKRIDRAAIGLTSGDEITSLSYGADEVSSYMDVRFSVDENTVGVAGSVVNTEAGKSPPEAHGDEFQASPVVVVDSASRVQYQILDENGDTAPPFPLMLGDDVQALTEHPASFVDRDGDGQLDRPVYFTLGAASPTLARINATPGDILVSDGSEVSTFISHEDLLLPEFNYIDAICLNYRNRRVAYSLDPMSMLVRTGVRTASDLLSNIARIPPSDFAFATFDDFGLLETDNINALKCVLPEVDYFPNTTASITVDGEEIALTGDTRFVVGVLGDGKTGEGNPLDYAGLALGGRLSGTSATGDVILLLQPVGIQGRVFESTNLRSGFLDMPPFASEGAGRLEVTAFGLNLVADGRDFSLPSSSPVEFTADVTRKPINFGESLCAGSSFTLQEIATAPMSVSVSNLCITPQQPVEPKPEFGPDSLLGAAAFEGAATGGLASLFVGISDFVDTTAVASTVPLSAQLAQTMVEFSPGSASALSKEQGSTVAAPLVFVSGPANQINLQVPWEIPPGVASVVVTAAGVASDPVEIAIAEFAPGIFSFDSGAGRAVAFYNDGAIVQPVGSFGLAARPAAVGEGFSLLATGMGPTDPVSVTGDSSSVGGTFVQRSTTTQPTVTIGGVQAQVFASILSPQFVGVYQVVVIPQAGTPAGDAVPVIIEIGGETSRDDVTVAISP